MERNDKFDKKDPMFDQAVELVSKLKTCSPATLQNRLAVGYMRAKRILEQMESAGIVGPEDAKGKRKVLMKNIELTWDGGGCCPGQWYAYFYNEQDNRTYCVYIREDSFWWSAALRSAEGRYSGDEFEALSVKSCLWKGIDLAFDYLADGEDWHFSKIVEETIFYLNHRFPYFMFDSKQREKYDFMDGVTEENRKSRLDVLERREELMRKYLAKYDEFKEKMNSTD